MNWKSVGSLLLVGMAASWSLSATDHSEVGSAAVPQEEQQDQQQKQATKSDFMIVKLDMAREIVAGLATADFVKMAKSADEMKKLSLESSWNVETTPDYLKLSADFRESAERLRLAANEKNIDAATLAYFEVTLNCVRCHKYIRDE